MPRMTTPASLSASSGCGPPSRRFRAALPAGAHGAALAGPLSISHPRGWNSVTPSAEAVPSPIDRRRVGGAAGNSRRAAANRQRTLEAQDWGQQRWGGAGLTCSAGCGVQVASPRRPFCSSAPRQASGSGACSTALQGGAP